MHGAQAQTSGSYLQRLPHAGMCLVVPRLLAQMIGTRSAETPGEDEVVYTYNSVLRPCLMVAGRTLFIPLVPRGIVSRKVWAELIVEHAEAAGRSHALAAIEVAACLDWMTWCVFMWGARWRPTDAEQDQVWHRMLDKPYYDDLVTFLWRVTSRYTGATDKKVVLEHVVHRDLTNGAFRPADQEAIMAKCCPELAEYMRGRALAECESAIRLAS